jgi:hypothetical protein
MKWNIAVDGEIVSLMPPLEYHFISEGLNVVVAPQEENAVDVHSSSQPSR